MRKLLVLLGLASLVVAGASFAQTDPDPDMIGIYVDPGATENHAEPGAAGPYDVYLCMTNPSAASGVSGWECSIIVTDGVFILEWGYAGSAINALSPPDFAVGLAEPLPWEPSIVLMTLTAGLFAPDPVEFTLTPQPIPSIPGDPYALPAYAAGDDPGDLRSLGYSTGWNPETGVPNVSCVLNGEPPFPIGTDEDTWGGVKNLYR
jgi:hypothetical protein